MDKYLIEINITKKQLKELEAEERKLVSENKQSQGKINCLRNEIALLEEKKAPLKKLADTVTNYKEFRKKKIVKNVIQGVVIAAYTFIVARFFGQVLSRLDSIMFSVLSSAGIISIKYLGEMKDTKEIVRETNIIDIKKQIEEKDIEIKNKNLELIKEKSIIMSIKAKLVCNYIQKDVWSKQITNLLYKRKNSNEEILVNPLEQMEQNVPLEESQAQELTKCYKKK